MSPERGQYRTTFEDITEKAKEILIQDGQHVPLLIIEGSKKLVVSQIQDMPDTHDERAALMRFFGQAAARTAKIGRLEQVFFVSEGWMSAASKDKPPEMRPSQDPQRKEVLIISGLELKTRRKQLRIFEMVRNPSKRVVDLQELTPTSGRGGEIEIPLLDAFAQGFQTEFQAEVG